MRRLLREMLKVTANKKQNKILNAGGLYGEARPENVPTVNDYRNPIIGEAMRGMKYVNMFNRGILWKYSYRIDG